MLARAITWLGLVALAAGCAGRRLPSSELSLDPTTSYEGPDQVHLDLLRTQRRGPRIYVQARIGDSEPLLFLVDTGADVNVLSTEVAESLELSVEADRFQLAGLSGRTSAGLAVVPKLSLGEASLSNVPFAVGVRGVGETAGFMPLAGILGMEVWRRFVLEIDYPRDRLTLHRPGTGPRLRRGTPLRFSGASIETGVEVTTDTDPSVTHQVVVQLDTGASALLLAGATGLPFAEVATEGLEPIYGVGASEFLPPSQFLRRTRRIPVRKVAFGGRRFKAQLQAQWLNYNRVDGAAGLATRGLLGHGLLAGHRVWIDPHQERLALRRAPLRPRRQLDGHRVLLDQDIARHGVDAPERDLVRARYEIALDQMDSAVERLERWIVRHPDDAEGRVLLARASRYLADLPGAWAAIEDLGPDGLTDEGEIIAAVNGLVYEGRVSRALTLARAAVEMRPDEAAAHIALADALVASGELLDANDALLEAARLRQNPNGFLLRRSRVALALGDRDGAMARVRRLVREIPTDGKLLWYYATMLRNEAEVATFRTDLNEAVERLHPNLRPLDFLVAAYHAIGEEERALAYLEEGLERDCTQFDDRAGKLNCIAWYKALAHQDLDRAARRVDRALEKSGPRADYLDTKAVVHLARGEVEQAHDAAMRAARLLPDDVYMQWQVERIAALLRRADDESPIDTGTPPDAPDATR